MLKALVLRAPGTNCDQEMCRAFRLAGAAADLIHIERLCERPDLLDDFDLVGFPGGFSYGDDIASGRLFALKLRERVYPALRRAAERGCPMIGACNGFQVLVQAGLLPGPLDGSPWPATAPLQTVALTDNQDAKFHDRWVGFTLDAESPCIWTRGLSDDSDEETRRQTHLLPVAHGEGRFVAATPPVMAALERNRQVVMRYADNYNGSHGAVAGICDASGRVFGLMPHPERYLDWTRHPAWTRLTPQVRKGETPGLRMFRNAVAAASSPAVPAA